MKPIALLVLALFFTAPSAFAGSALDGLSPGQTLLFEHPGDARPEQFTIEPQWPVGIAPPGQEPGSFENPYILRGDRGNDYEIRPSFPFGEPGGLLNPYRIAPR
jgi:hypothetical protein